jgi:hypothetical protein
MLETFLPCLWPIPSPVVIFFVHSYTTSCSFGDGLGSFLFWTGIWICIFLAATGYLIHTEMYLSLYTYSFSVLCQTSSLLSHNQKWGLGSAMVQFALY